MSRPRSSLTVRTPGLDGRRAVAAATLGAAATMFCLMGCAGSRPLHRVGPIGRDSAGVVHLIGPNSAKSTSVHAVPTTPLSGVQTIPTSPSGGRSGTEGKIHPALLNWSGPDTIAMIVTFRDLQPIPVFPVEIPGQPDSIQFIQSQAVALAMALAASRAAQYTLDSTVVTDFGGVDYLSRFWLIRALVVRAPVSRVKEMASLRSVTYVRPVNAGERPPACTDTDYSDAGCTDGNSDSRCPNGDDCDDVIEAINRIGAGDLRAAGYGVSRIGVLDTGVNMDHVLLTSQAARTGDAAPLLFDCSETCDAACLATPSDIHCSDCPKGNRGDLCGDGHGTSTAAILVGRNAAFPRFRGVTSASLDWFDVYDQPCNKDCDHKGKDDDVDADLDACSTIHAFEQVLLSPQTHVIVAEVAGEGGDSDPINVAAAHAFLAGKVVIAAAGNLAGVPTCPGREATVMAVGGRYLTEWKEFTTSKPSQRFGRIDGRLKPEILAPTSTETASRCSDHSFREFSYTSGATPYIGGAALLIWEWLANMRGLTDPGHTYAHLILSGTTRGPFSDESSGAGLLDLPARTSRYWLGKEEVHKDEPPFEANLDAGLAGFGAAESLKVAAWWPESQADGATPHHFLKLEIVDEMGKTLAVSDDEESVFQRTTAAIPLCTPAFTGWTDWRFCFLGSCFQIRFPLIGTNCLKVRITADDVPEAEAQTVYWSAVAR